MWLSECVESFCSGGAVELPELHVLGGLTPFKDSIKAAGSCSQLATYVKVVLHLLGAGGCVGMLLRFVNARTLGGDVSLDVCLSFCLVLACSVVVKVEVSSKAVLQCVGYPIPVLLECVVVGLVTFRRVTGGFVNGLVDRSV